MESLGLILIEFIVIVSIILILLRKKEKKLHKEVIVHKKRRDTFYEEEIKSIKESSPKEALGNLDRISRKFFKEAFGMRKSVPYSELEKNFTKRGNKKAANFCKRMSQTLYSKGKYNRTNIKKLLKLLVEIVEITHISPEEEREEIEKSKGKKSIKDYLNNIKIFGIGKKKLNNEKDNTQNNQIIR